MKYSSFLYLVFACVFAGFPHKLAHCYEEACHDPSHEHHEDPANVLHAQLIGRALGWGALLTAVLRSILSLPPLGLQLVDDLILCQV